MKVMGKKITLSECSKSYIGPECSKSYIGSSFQGSCRLFFQRKSSSVCNSKGFLYSDNKLVSDS